MGPTGEEITEAIKALKIQSPNLGRKKLVAQLNTDKGWSLTSKDIKENLLQQPESEMPLGDTIQDCKETSAPKLKGNDRKADKTVSKRMDKDVGATTHKDNDKPETEPGSSHGGIPQADSPQQKSNCFLIRAKPHSSTPPLQDITSQVEPFNLNSYGSEMGEMGEMRELKTRLGWKNAREVGKFYDHEGADGWYYYVYGEEGSSRPKNEAASLVCYNKRMKGDIAVIRSGPSGTDTPEYFTQRELSEAVEFYKAHDRLKVFNERERSRMMSRMGVDLQGVPYFYVNETSQGFSFSGMP